MAEADVDTGKPASGEVVGLWCYECRRLRGPNGERLGFNGNPEPWSERCGKDYGEGFVSHLNVAKVVIADA